MKTNEALLRIVLALIKSEKDHLISNPKDWATAVQDLNLRKDLNSAYKQGGIDALRNLLALLQ